MLNKMRLFTYSCFPPPFSIISLCLQLYGGVYLSITLLDYKYFKGRDSVLCPNNQHLSHHPIYSRHSIYANFNYNDVID